MKVKNIVFSGVMGAILMGATGAHAAISVASQGYVDAKVGKVATSVTELGTTVSSTYQTKADAATAAQQTSAALDLKANAADVYTKEYVNTELAKLELKTDAIDKLNAAKDYTEEQINALKGALGTGGEGEEGGDDLDLGLGGDEGGEGGEEDDSSIDDEMMGDVQPESAESTQA